MEELHADPSISSISIFVLYLLPFVDIETVVLQFLLQDIWDVNINVDDLLLTFPLNVCVWLNPLKQGGNKILGYIVQDVDKAVMQF